VEQTACSTGGLVGTVGRAEVKPGAGNVIAGSVALSLDVRHASDPVRGAAVAHLLERAREIAARRGLGTDFETRLDQPAVAMDGCLSDRLARAVEESGHPVYRMNSGAGHDAMIMARRMPAAMLFLRTPGGISHHPDESLLKEDVAAAIAAGQAFLEDWEKAGV
jgi:allantoate deiminase